MCGFSGFLGFASQDKNNSLEILLRMNSSLDHRGPDSEGYWIEENRQIALGHKRLSILDLSDAGAQPMHSRSGKYVLSFNGEIYNHQSLRIELMSEVKDHKWRGNSDTETLVECIDRWGLEATLNKSEGMFAFALWSEDDHCLYLARDRFGEKPIYYGWIGSGISESFIFSSELKALKAHPNFNPNLSRDAIALQMRLSCIPAPLSIYEGIYKLEPAQILQVSLKDKNIKKSCYWPLEEVFLNGYQNPFHGTIEEATENLHNLLLSKVNDQMLSDVPLGAFLSGGIDSATIVSLMQSQSSDKIKTFTIGFDIPDYNEAEFAKTIAEHLGTDHTELYLTGRDAINVIPNLSSIYDEPFSDSSQIPTYLVSKLAKESVTVALSGDGGDEIFGGYNRYLFSHRYSGILLKTPYILRKFIYAGILKFPGNLRNSIGELLKRCIDIPNFPSKFRKTVDLLNVRNQQELYTNLISNWKDTNNLVFDSSETNNFVSSLMEELDPTSFMMLNDLMLYLPDDILTKVDRASMNVSLESRVPFLNHQIFEFASTLPLHYKIRGSETKHILRRILYKYVPSSIMERPKFGFAVPIESWLKNDLKEWSLDLLNKEKLEAQGYLNCELISKMLNEHIEGFTNHDQKLWDVLMFQSWLDDQL